MHRLTALVLLLPLLLNGCSDGPGVGPEGGKNVVYVTPDSMDDPADLMRPAEQRVGDLQDCPNCDAGSAFSGTGPVPFTGQCPICEGSGTLFGTLYWESGWYEAPGYTRLVNAAPTRVDWAKAEQGAKASAYRNAVKLAAMVQLDEENTLSVRSGEIELEAFVRGQQIKDSKRYTGANKWAYKQARVPMYGVSGLNAKVFSVESGYYRRSAAVFESSGTLVYEEEVTDIIVDARDADVAPALFPKILTDDGRIVYDLQSADSDVVASDGLVTYYISEKELGADMFDGSPFAARLPRGQVDLAELIEVAQRRKRRRRTGWKPVVVKTSGAGTKVNVIVSKKDAEKIKAADKKSGVLKKARVIVVVGSRVAGKRGGLARPVRVATLRR